MRVVALTLFLLLASRLAAPSAARAQYHHVTDGLVVGATLGKSDSGSERVGSRGPEASALVELPLGDRWRLRGEGGVGAWQYKGDPSFGVTGSAMQRYRLTASLLTSRTVLSPAERFRGYAGGGAGLYVHHLPDQPDDSAWGVHGIAGVELLLPTTRSRWIVGGEIQLYLHDEPKGPRPEGITMVGAHASVVVKYRLP